MEVLDIINKIAKISSINIFIYFIFIKLINYKDNNYKKTIIIVLLSIIEGIIARLFSNFMVLPVMILVYVLHSFIIAKITINKLDYSIIVTFISLTITYITYIISVVLVAVMIKIIGINIEKNNIISLILIVITESLILYKVHNIKRFKNGISFLKNKEKIENIGIIGFAFIGTTLLLYSVMGYDRGDTYMTALFTGILIEAICLTIWIRRKITKQYKQNLKKNTIEELENEIKAKDEEINKILEENKTIATINHKYSSRIKALEKISAKILTKPELVETMKTEFGEEFGELQSLINKISEEYSKELADKIKHKTELEKTGIFGIDNILEYMQEEAEKENIKFDVKLNGNINYMIEKVIEQSRLETLLGDHIKDAIIAIKNSDNTYRSILTTIGIINNCYEIRIYDTGIEFEIETLLKLGTEAVTTHKETGGSGIGFMTTFETLKETKASLIIEEKHPISNTDYTKVVAIRFDGKNEYKIKSYRAEEIRKQRKDDRVIVNFLEE